MKTITPKILSAKLIPAPHPELLDAYGAQTSNQGSFGLLTCDRDHALYVALDEATKASPVTVLYTHSFYGGSTTPSGPLSGEAIGILAGADDDIVREGLKAAIWHLDDFAHYFSTTAGLDILFFPHVISSVGSFLSKHSGVSAGDALAYLIAPPIESVIAVDQALKASDVRVVKHFAPPTETNFGGVLLTGELPACNASAAAFADALETIAQQPVDSLK